MSYLDFPNDTHHDAIGEIPNENTMFETDIDEELDQLKYTFFPDPELTKLNGSYRIGVKLVREFLVTLYCRVPAGRGLQQTARAAKRYGTRAS